MCLEFHWCAEYSNQRFLHEKKSGIELAQRGMWKGYFALDNKKKLDKFAFVWVDRYKGYFISNASSLKPGIIYSRDSLRQVGDITNANPFHVEFETNHPRGTERYHSINLNIDESSRMRQDDLQLERKLQTNDCSIRGLRN